MMACSSHDREDTACFGLILTDFLLYFPASVLPFRIQFLTDQWEYHVAPVETAAGIQGFKLRYFQKAC
jgi:hypothetical protein